MKASKNYVMALLGLFLLASASNAFAFTAQKLAGEAKISLEQARGIALKAHPGKITDEELEQEKRGGSVCLNKVPSFLSGVSACC